MVNYFVFVQGSSDEELIIGNRHTVYSVEQAHLVLFSFAGYGFKESKYVSGSESIFNYTIVTGDAFNLLI